jgi:hypothetical protein
MTSYFWAIADAGGNIYPGTFSTTKFGAQCLRMFGDFIGSGVSSQYVEGEGNECVIKESFWLSSYRVHKGDHLVRCKVETEDKIVVTQVDDP